MRQNNALRLADVRLKKITEKQSYLLYVSSGHYFKCHLIEIHMNLLLSMAGKFRQQTLPDGKLM